MKRGIILLLIWAIVFVLFSTLKVNAYTCTHYVSADGNDAAGTDFASLEYALENGGLVQGNVLCLEHNANNIPTFNYWKVGSTDNRTIMSIGAGDGTQLVIQSNDSSKINLNIPLDVGGGMFWFSEGTTTRFVNMNFTNNNSLVKNWFTLYANRTLIIENSTADGNRVGSGAYLVQFPETGAGPTQLAIMKSIMKNYYVGIRVEGLSSNVKVNITSSILYNQTDRDISTSSGAGIDLILINNDISITGSGTGDINLQGNSNNIVIKNNIIKRIVNNTFTAFLGFGNASALDYLANSSKYNITNNVFWTDTMNGDNVDVTNARYALNALVFYSVFLLPLNLTNRFANPEWDDANSNFTMNSTSKAQGWGDSSVLPTADFNGVVWSGAHVGAFNNTNLTQFSPNISTTKFAFSGDSIMDGVDASIGQTGFDIFANISGLNSTGGSSDTNLAAIGSLQAQALWPMIDYVFLNVNPAPKYWFISVGLNNIGNNLPSNYTSASLNSTIVEIMNRIESWGGTPYWMGMPSLSGDSPNNTNVIQTNSYVESWCDDKGLVCGSIFDQMQLNPSWQTSYYDNLTADVHPNNAGHQLIGKLAGYLYFNRSVISMDFSCSPISTIEQQRITCSCSAIDLLDSSPTISYTINPTTSDIGTFTTTCTATDNAYFSAMSSISYTIMNNGGSYPAYKPTQEQLESKNGYEVSLQKNWQVQFRISNETHTIKLDNILNKTATITVSSNPITFNISVNETKKIDLDDDEYYEMSIFLKNISNTQANLIIRSTNEKVIKSLSTKIDEKTISYGIAGMITVIVLIIIVIYFLLKMKRRKNKSKHI